MYGLAVWAEQHATMLEVAIGEQQPSAGDADFRAHGMGRPRCGATRGPSFDIVVQQQEQVAGGRSGA